MRKLAKEKKEKMMKKLKEKQDKILGDKKEEVEDYDNVCIICRQSNKNAPLYYICKLKLTNLLGSLLEKEQEPYLVLSTCGHKIHEACQSENIRDTSQNKSNY